MSSPTFDPSFVPPESWPVLDAAAVPVSSDDELQSHWRQPRARPTQQRLVLRDLVLADRPDRRGFSFEVLDELVRLQAYAVR